MLAGQAADLLAVSGCFSRTAELSIAELQLTQDNKLLTTLYLL